MAFQGSIKSTVDADSTNSLFVSNSHDKRNLWWKAFRQTVLEPRAIAILETPVTDKVPEGLLSLVEEKCQNIERHERQALRFVEAVGQGRGFGVSPIFPKEIVPANRNEFLSRCLEPDFDTQTLPPQEDNIRIPVFDLPTPKPGLVSGFSQQAFSEAEYKEIPMSLASVGTLNDHSSGGILPRQTVYGSFLLFERTYGHAKHEIEFAMNYCAINGTMALNAISMLYEDVWPDKTPRPTKVPVVFSCVIDNDLAIINHHWMSEGGFFVAPLCKFDIRDLEHFMHFLAWIEAIEEWAVSVLLPDILKALQVLVDRKNFGLGRTKALPSPVTDVEKQEMLSRSMRLAFDNMPWKGERFRKTPLGVTGAMRMRSPTQLPCSGSTTPSVPVENKDINDQPQQENVVIISANLATTTNPKSVTTASPLPVTEPIADSVTTTNPDPTTTTISSPINNPVAHLQNPIVETTEDVVEPSIASPPEQASEGKNSRMGLTLIKSAGLTKNREPAKDMRQVTSAGLPTSKSSSSATLYSPGSRVESSMSPATTVYSAGARSPAQSMMSMQSKRSFTSLRKAKVKSPMNWDSGSNGSSKGISFKTKISSSLDAIKEHTLPKRQRSDNSAPSSAKDAPPLPTPAYDKKRFEISTPRSKISETPQTIPEVPVPPPAILSESSPLSLPKAKEASKPADIDAYHARHTLPLRQWAKSPTSAVTATTTITAVGF